MVVDFVGRQSWGQRGVISERKKTHRNTQCTFANLNNVFLPVIVTVLEVINSVNPYFGVVFKQILVNERFKFLYVSLKHLYIIFIGLPVQNTDFCQ